MSGSTAHGSDEYNKADRVLTRDVKLNPHPELANYHSEPTTLPVAEVLRKDPEKEKQAANTESGEEEGGGGSEDSDDLMDAEEWENRFTDLPSLNDEEEEKWERTFYDTDNFGDDEDSFDDLNDVDEEEDEEVAEDRKNAARVRAHFAHIYPDFKTKRGAWNAFDMDTADPPFDTRDEDILTRISQYYVAVVPTVRDFPRPPNSMLRQALQEVRARAAPKVSQTDTYMRWFHGGHSGSAPSKIFHWPSYMDTIRWGGKFPPLKPGQLDSASFQTYLT